MLRQGLRVLMALVVVTAGASAASAAPDAPAGPTASPAPTAPALTWGMVPATADGVADGRVSFRVEVDPGETVTEHALLTNYSDQAAEFQIVASDGVVAADGTFDILPGGEAPRDGGAWIDVEDAVVVPPHAGVVVPFTIAVPADVTPGDHPAGITAGVSRGSSSEAGPQMGLTTRVGLRLHLRVTGDLDPALAVQGLALRYETSWNPFAPGRLHVEYSVANTGNVRLLSDEALRYSGPWRVAANGYAGEPMAAREILPGGTKDVTAEVGRLWPWGRVTGTVVATPAAVGQDDLAGAALAAAGATAGTWAVPWSQLVVLAGLVAAGWVLARRRRRRRAAFAAALERARAEGAAAALAAAGDEGSSPALVE